MRLEQLYYFAKIYDEKSISKAAEQLFVSQPALSIAISNLEKELGVRLFDRNRNGLSVTAEGERIIGFVREIIHNVDNIHESLHKQNPMPELYILSAPVVSTMLLPEVLGKWQRTFANVKLQVEEAAHSQFVEDYLAKAKAGVRCFGIGVIEDESKAVAVLQNQGFCAEHLGTDRFCCCAKAGTFAQKEVTLKECQAKTMLFHGDTGKDLQLISSASPTAADKVWQVFLKKTNSISVNSLEMLKQMVVGGMGITVMPSMMLYGDHRTETGELQIFDLQDFVAVSDYYLFYPQAQPLAPHEQTFVDILKESFAQWERQKAQFWQEA